MPMTPEQLREALGPNKKWPFGIRVINKSGHVAWERYRTADVRDVRAQVIKLQGDESEAVDWKEPNESGQLPSISASLHVGPVSIGGSVNADGSKTVTVTWRDKLRKRVGQLAQGEGMEGLLEMIAKPAEAAAAPIQKPALKAPKSTAKAFAVAAGPNANPYAPGTQKAICYDLLADQKPHTKEELKTVNPKYPMDPVSFLEKDGRSHGRWTIARSSGSVALRFT